MTAPDNLARHPLPGLASGAEGPIFAEPWQAQIFAITVKLSEAGHFTWPEWAGVFGQALAQAARGGAPADGSNYYDVWLTALETLLTARGLAAADALAGFKQAWTDAYLATPHGQPVKLADTPTRLGV